MSKVLSIAQELQSKIKKGLYKEGDKLPTEMELCEIYSSSRMTVRKALEKLIDNGWVYRIQGSGNYVSKDVSKVTYVGDSKSIGLTQYMKGEKLETKVLKLVLISMPEDIAIKMKCQPDSKVYYIERVRYIEGEPQVIENTYFLEKYVHGLNEGIAQGSTYNYIENVLGYKIQKTSNVITAKNASKREAEILECEEGSALVVAETTAYLDNGNIFEFSVNYHKGDKAKFVLIRNRA